MLARTADVVVVGYTVAKLCSWEFLKQPNPIVNISTLLLTACTDVYLLTNTFGQKRGIHLGTTPVEDFTLCITYCNVTTTGGR